MASDATLQTCMLCQPVCIAGHIWRGAGRMVDRAIRRARVFWWEDGVTELVFGVWCLLFALLHLVAAALPGTVGNAVLALGLVLIAPLVRLCQAAVKAVKRRVTEPRGGFAE